MSDAIECPLCKTRIVITQGNQCPACRRNVFDKEAIRREERIDHVYSLLWEQHQAGKSLRAAVAVVRTDPVLDPADIAAGQAAFLEEGRRKFLYRGTSHLQMGLLLLFGGIACAFLQLMVPIPIIVVFTGAIALGLVDSLFGLWKIIKYWYYFVR